jgi:hypothetical protein
MVAEWTVYDLVKNVSDSASYETLHHHLAPIRGVSLDSIVQWAIAQLAARKQAPIAFSWF